MSLTQYEFKLDESAKQYAKDILNETDSTREESINEIRKWLQENPNLNACLEDVSILAFLRGCKFNLERTKEKLSNYYVMKSEIPQWFANRDPTLSEIQELVRLGVFVPLRKLNDNRLVVIIRTAAHDPRKHKQDDVFKAGKMILDIAAFETEQAQIYGVTAIFDMTNISVGHARQMTPSIIKKAVHAWQNYHCRPKQLEFIHAPYYINVVLNVFKSFMSDKLKSRIKVHFSGLESLYEHVDKTVLPVEYGGSDGHFQEHIDIWSSKMVEYKDWFAHDEQFKAVLP